MLTENLIVFINALPNPVFIQDISGVYIECNDRFAIYFDRHKSDIIGKTIIEIVNNKELVDKVSSVNYKLINQSNQHEGQFSWAGHSIANSYKSFIVNKSLLRNSEGEVYGIIGTITDTTNSDIFNNDLIRTKNKLYKNGIDNDALRLLSHEFRTPMNIITGFTDILYLKEDDTEKKELIRQIKINNERLLKLIINILQIAEIESEDFYLRNETIDINNLIKDSIEQYGSKARAKNISIFFKNNNFEHKKIYSSRFAVTVILSNLLSNAIKYSYNGEIMVKLNCIEGGTDRKIFQIIVEDQGIGISPDKLTTIFDKFTQVYNNEGEYFTGAGLGLNIVQQLIDTLNGNILVESTLNKGSRFTVNLPVEQEKIIS